MTRETWQVAATHDRGLLLLWSAPSGRTPCGLSGLGESTRGARAPQKREIEGRPPGGRSPCSSPIADVAGGRSVRRCDSHRVAEDRTTCENLEATMFERMAASGLHDVGRGLPPDAAGVDDQRREAGEERVVNGGVIGDHDDRVGGGEGLGSEGLGGHGR